MSHRDKIQIAQGDLTAENVDAIVNGANTSLFLTNAIAGAIHLKGGATIQGECDKIGSAEMGEAVITGAGELPAKHVIHAVVNYIGETPTTESIRTAVRNTMKVAEEKYLKTISFPAIGADIGALPADEVARVMVNEVYDFLGNSTIIDKVRFIMLDSRTHDAFRKALDNLSK